MTPPPEFRGTPGRTEKEADKKAQESRSLVWQVNPKCPLPLSLQLWILRVIRWFKRSG